MISVVIPAYQSSESLPILIGRLEVVLHTLDQEYEIIVVDDCSPDDTWATLKKLKSSHRRLKIIRLLRNSGQHNAILCGFSIAGGDVVVTMDDDLQNPPEEIPKLLTAINEGCDLAIGSYENKKHSIGRNFGGSLVDDVQRRIFNLPGDFQLTSFRAVRKVVVDQVLAMSGVFPYITSMLFSHSARYINVPVRHETRSFGRSNYTMKRSVRLAANLLLNYSSYPLYLVAALCLVALGLCSGLGIFVVLRVVSEDGVVPGWASTIAAISFFNGLVLAVLVIHSIYLSRLNQQLTRTKVAFSIGEIHE